AAAAQGGSAAGTRGVPVFRSGHTPCAVAIRATAHGVCLLRNAANGRVLPAFRQTVGPIPFPEVTMTRKLLAAAVLFVLVGAVVAEEQPAPPLVTRTYDLKPILNARSRPADLTDTDAVIRLILQTVRVGELKPDGAYLIERENGLLEVRATEQAHGEIKDLLTA